MVNLDKNPGWEPPYEAQINAGDYNQYLGNIKIGETPGGRPSDEPPPPEKTPVLSIGDVLTNAFVTSLDAFFYAASTGSIKDAISMGFLALGQALAQGINIMIQEAMPGPGGAILGAIGGGLINMLFGRIFRGKSTETKKIPVLAEITNWPDPFKAWTLPTSRYLNPNSWNIGHGSFIQNNHISITGTPKLASKVQRALTEPQFLRQAARRNV